MMDSINPYLAVGVLMVITGLYSYYLGYRDGRARGHEEGWNWAHDRERKDNIND